MRRVFSLNRKGMLVAVSLALAAPVAYVATASGQAPGYVFSDIGVGYAPHPVTGQDDPSTARVTYTYAWQGSFPGAMLCEFTVRSSDGTIVGSKEAGFTGLDPQRAGAFTDVAVAGMPASAEISCDPGRLDDASGRFEVSKVDVEQQRGPGGRANPRAVRLGLTARWTGGGDPAPQECLATVRGESGDVLFRDSFVLTSRSPVIRGAQTTLLADRDLPESATSASMSCEPFGG